MSYTKSDYLQGRTPPPPHELEEDEIVIKTYCYGVKRSSKGRLHAFVCLEKNFQKQRGVVIHEVLEQDAKQAEQLSFEMLKQVKQERKKEVTIEKSNHLANISKPPLIHEGSIVIHADGQGQHTAIVLIKKELDSVLLFVTSNPYWGKVVREMTIDEQILIGHSVKQKPSFFVRVNRSNEELLSTESSFPKHRTAELKEEFCPWLNYETQKKEDFYF